MSCGLLMLILLLSGLSPSLAASDEGGGADINALSEAAALGSTEDFALNSRSANLTVTTSATAVRVMTEMYCISVDHATSFIEYEIRPYFASDVVRYGRADPKVAGSGTVDQYGIALDSVRMTLTWGQQGDTVWFLESCAEFSIRQSFAIYRDYFELSVTYTPGSRDVLTTYYFGLYTSTNALIDLFDNGENYRYVPGYAEDTPAGYGLGGWYPSFKMFAPACDIRVPNGDLGVEWGYDETVAYIGSPVWLKGMTTGGDSLFGLKFSSMNSVVPNIALGSEKTFHMFVRPYRYSDGETRGHDVGYAQWVAPRIAAVWGNHNTPIFPLAIMDTGSWTAAFRSWVESSQVKLATYSNNPDQINWNYKSAQVAGQTNVPLAWQLLSSLGIPMLTSESKAVCNPVSGPYDMPGTFRWKLIMNDAYQDWWTSTEAVFWDEMNNWDANNRLKSDYQGRSDFIYSGFLDLIDESYRSGFWSYVIANSFTGLLHLAIASDISLIEGYEPSSIYGEDMIEHVRSTMDFVNNIPSEFRPRILVYQNYATSSASDQQDVYSILFGSAAYGYHVELLSYDSYESQMHNLVMAESMFKAMGCSRDSDTRISVATLDLARSSSLTTSSSMVVTKGAGAASITLTEAPQVFKITDLWGTQNPFDVTMPTNRYFEAGAYVTSSAPMTFRADGSATFHGVIQAERSGEVTMSDYLEVAHRQTGSVDVRMISRSTEAVHLAVSASAGTTTITLHGLEPQRSYDIVVNDQNTGQVESDGAGTISFDRAYRANDTVTILISEIVAAAPRILTCIPMDDSDAIEVDANIQIGFSEPMDRVSTEAAFSLTCQSNVVQGSFDWSDGKTQLTFTPEALLNYSTGYLIEVEAQAEDILGGRLETAFASSFIVADEPSTPTVPTEPETPALPTEEPNDPNEGALPPSNSASVTSFYLAFFGHLPGEGGDLAYAQTLGAISLFSLLGLADLALHNRRHDKRRQGFLSIPSENGAAHLEGSPEQGDGLWHRLRLRFRYLR